MRLQRQLKNAALKEKDTINVGVERTRGGPDSFVEEVEWKEGVSPSSPHRTVRDTLASYGSYSQTQIHGETMLQ